MMLGGVFINLLFMGPINLGIPSLVMLMHWHGNTYAYFETSFGIGAVIGGVICGALGGLRGNMRWIGAIGAVMGIGMCILN